MIFSHVQYKVPTFSFVFDGCHQGFLLVSRQSAIKAFKKQSEFFPSILKLTSSSRPLIKRGITEFRLRISDVLLNSREEFYCSNNRLYKYKVLRCIVAQV